MGVSITNTCILQVVAILYYLPAGTLQAERKDAAIRSLGVCRKDTLIRLEIGFVLRSVKVEWTPSRAVTRCEGVFEQY